MQMSLSMVIAETKCESPEGTAKAPSYSHRHLVGYAQGLRTRGFGGPVAVSKIMPGPLATQLAIYLGYVHYLILGAMMVGIAFVLPSFLMVIAISWAYLTFGVSVR